MTQAIIVVLVVLSLYLTYRSLKHPGYAFALVLSLYAFEQVLQSGNAIFRASGSFLNLAFGGAACLAILASLFRRGMKFPAFPQAVIYLLALFFLASISIGWSVNTDVSLHWAKTFLPYVVLFTLILPFCMMDHRDIGFMISGSLMLGLFVGLGMALGNYGHRGIVLDTIGGKDLEANPLAAGNYGGYIAIIAIFAIYSKPKKANWPFLFKAAVALLGIFVLFRSGSRGQIIACILSVMFWLPIVAKVAAKRSTIIALVLATTIMVGLVYLVANSDNSVRWRADSLNDGASGRLNGGMALVTHAAQEGPMRLLFGLGNGASFSVLGWYPHLVPLEILGEEGLIGFALFLLFVSAVYRDGYRTLKMQSADIQARVHMGVMLSLFTFELILSCKQGSLLISPGAGMFCIGAALSWSAMSVLRTTKKQHLRQYYQVMRFQSSGPQYRQ